MPGRFGIRTDRAGLQGGKDLTIDIWKVLALEALKGDVLVARIAALDKALVDVRKEGSERAERMSRYVDDVVQKVRGDGWSAWRNAWWWWRAPP